MGKKDEIKYEQTMLHIEESLNELYLMFSLNAVNFVEDIEKRLDYSIKEYAKLNVKYVISLNLEFENAESENVQKRNKREIIKRLKTLYVIISNAEKLDKEIEYYTRVVWDINEIINHYSNIKVG